MNLDYFIYRRSQNFEYSFIIDEFNPRHSRYHYFEGSPLGKGSPFGQTGPTGHPGCTGITEPNDSIYTTYELDRYVSTYRNMVYNHRDLAINLPKELINMVCEYIDLYKFDINTISRIFTEKLLLKLSVKDVYAIQNNLGNDYILIGKTHNGKYFNSYCLDGINECIKSKSLLTLSQDPKFRGLRLFYNQQIREEHYVKFEYSENYIKKGPRSPSTIFKYQQPPQKLKTYNKQKQRIVQKHPHQQKHKVVGFKRKN